VLALMRLSGKPWLVMPAAAYVNTMRSDSAGDGDPVVLPADPAGDRRPLGAELSAIITFTLFEAAYYSEIMRAGIQSVPRGQVHAGYAVGMTYRQTMQLIVLPQAFRNMLPVLLTQTIILFQDTSLVYAIGAYDLLKGFEVAGKNFNRPVETYLVAAVSTSSSASACRCWSSGCRPRSPSSAEAGRLRDRSIKNVSKWYGSFQVLTDCTTTSRRARWWWSAARRARASPR
jgi:glutamate/aspartate transport system permease protein